MGTASDSRRTFFRWSQFFLSCPNRFPPRLSTSQDTGKIQQVIFFFLSSKTIELFPGDYDNKTWINFGWGHQSLSELWNRATYDVRTRVKPTIEMSMYFILCWRGKGKVKSCIEICSTQHSIKGLLLAFLQTWSSLYIWLELSNISI